MNKLIPIVMATVLLSGCSHFGFTNIGKGGDGITIKVDPGFDNDKSMNVQVSVGESNQKK